MSIFEKLGFKKKEDAPFEEGRERGAGSEGPDFEHSGSMGAMPPMRKQSMPDFSSSSEPGTAPFEMSRPSAFQSQENRGLDLVNAKLDTIKAVLDNINSRLERLEHMASSASEEQKIPRWR